MSANQHYKTAFSEAICAVEEMCQQKGNTIDHARARKAHDHLQRAVCASTALQGLLAGVPEPKSGD